MFLFVISLSIASTRYLSLSFIIFIMCLRSHATMQVTMLTRVVSGCCAHTLSKVAGDVKSGMTLASTSPGAGLMSNALLGCSYNDLEF
jgi:hypothetical protein